MQALIAERQRRRILQSINEIKPRRLPPPSKTAWNMSAGQQPGVKIGEEPQAALKAME